MGLDLRGTRQNQAQKKYSLGKQQKFGSIARCQKVRVFHKTPTDLKQGQTVDKAEQTQVIKKTNDEYKIASRRLDETGPKITLKMSSKLDSRRLDETNPKMSTRTKLDYTRR